MNPRELDLLKGKVFLYYEYCLQNGIVKEKISKELVEKFYSLYKAKNDVSYIEIDITKEEEEFLINVFTCYFNKLKKEEMLLKYLREYFYEQKSITKDLPNKELKELLEKDLSENKLSDNELLEKELSNLFNTVCNYYEYTLNEENNLLKGITEYFNIDIIS